MKSVQEIFNNEFDYYCFLKEEFNTAVNEQNARHMKVFSEEILKQYDKIDAAYLQRSIDLRLINFNAITEPPV